MKYTVTGKVHTIFATKHVSERFSKRDFVVETYDNPRYPQLVSFQATGKVMDELDHVSDGDTVSVDFEIKGREHRNQSGEVRYYNTLDAYKIVATGAGRSVPATNAEDDIAF